jgi:hypothetical protein
MGPLGGPDEAADFDDFSVVIAKPSVMIPFFLSRFMILVLKGVDRCQP